MTDMMRHTFMVHFENGEYQQRLDFPLRLIYKKSEPLAISFVFDDAGTDVEWLVSRELCQKGTQGLVAGEGDIKVMPKMMPECACRGVRFLFTASSGWQEVIIHYGELFMFVKSTYLMVPFHKESEYIDIDSFINDVLKG